MTRELKFRAWDKKTKSMREVDSVAFFNRRGVFCPDDSHLPKVVNIWGRNPIESSDVIMHREAKDCDLMQFTGLYDKNGKEIYEGDILNSYSSDSEHFPPFVVEWREVGLTGFHCVNSNDHCYIDFDQDTVSTHAILGNIYENPELLK